jgi:heme-degrading monooxygenase HmoA
MIAFFNVFHVDPADQQRAIDLLTTVTENFVSKAPGFISSTLHRSSDGTTVAMYARWRSQADYDAMRRDPSPLAALNELMTIARFEPGQYDVVQDFAGAAS